MFLFDANYVWHPARSRAAGRPPGECPNMTIESLAQGCLLGAFVGDAAGARLEFLGRQPRPSEVAAALQMLGGGVLAVAPGQVTDDGELTLALARALQGTREFPAQRVASNYRAWLQSHPFDVGHATSSALGALVQPGSALADALAIGAALHNRRSKANGALMRHSALGIWAVNRTLEETVDAVRSDTRLTHPNPSCVWASVAYVVAIRHLLLNEGDARDAFEQARAVLPMGSSGNLGGRDIDEKGGDPEDGPQEVRQWLDEAERGELPGCHPMAGFVRIAFTHAFHHLVRQTPFEQALGAVLGGGGDTDTNACIVGGLVGARVGLAGIPEPMWRAVLACDTAHGQPRPIWLQTRDALQIASALVRHGHSFG